jgi:hypothetical protein
MVVRWNKPDRYVERKRGITGPKKYSKIPPAITRDTNNIRIMITTTAPFVNGGGFLKHAQTQRDTKNKTKQNKTKESTFDSQN